jgi:tetratricopeptide (TPR) repeat protein
MDHSAAARRPALNWLVPVALAVVAFAVYARTLGFDFVYDDYAQIVETKQLNSWRMIPRYFTGHVWSWKTPGVPGPYYRPVFLLWLLANQMLFGADAAWWHLTSVLAHVTATLLVYAVARRLSGDLWVGAFAALLFGVHPVHVEDVAWVSSITEPLVAVFLLSAFWCYLRGGPKWRMASLALFALGLLEKETAVMLPLLIFAYEWLLGVRRKALNAALPYAAVTLIYLGIRSSVLHGFILVITPVPLRQMVYTWPSMLVFYLKHLTWPVGVNLFYNLPVVARPDFQSFGLFVLILALAGAALWLWAVRSRLAAFAALWMILPILPVLNIRVFAHNENVHDRYLYVPSIGFCILAALSLRWLLSKPRPVAALAACAGVAIAGAFAFQTVDQQQYWDNNLTLFERAVEVSPDNEIANQGLGTSLMLKGLMAEAIPYYRRALQLQPEMYESAYSLGRCYYELGEYGEAAPFLIEAANLKPWEAKPLLYYGLSEWKQGRRETAERALRQAIRIKGPDDYREYHLSLGLVLKDKGDLPAALREFQAETEENPEPAKALEQIAEIKGKQP